MTSRGSRQPSLGSRSLNILLIALLVGMTATGAQAAQSQSQVTKHDITWTFDRAYTVGQFVNGDWWVLDDGSGVRVNSVSPAPSGSGSSYLHGSMINPVGDAQGYDGRLYDYTSSLSVSYPVTLQSGKSLVSIVSITNQVEACDTGQYVDIYGHCVNAGHSYVWKAACLTVVSQIPAADAFRPPYAGTNKVIHRASEIQWDILPGLSLASKPSLTTVNKISNCFQEIWLEKSTWTGRMIHPLKNQPNYGREIGSAVSEASALLMLDYSQSEIHDLMIGFVQTGIDLYAISQNGVSWRGEGGHDNGRKWPIIFAGIMLNDAGMKAVNGSFGEDGQTYYGQAASSNPGQSKVAFFGQDCVSPYTETCSGSGAKDCRDPLGLKDACPDYRNCCSSHTWVGQALAAHMLAAESLWGHDAFFDYVDRWMRFGNDPPVDGGGSSQISYIDAMWQTYRASLEEVDNTPPLAPTGLSMQNNGMNQITLQWNAPSPASDGDRASSYRVYRNQVMLQGVAATTFTDGGLAPGTSYSYAVYSVDNVGNVSSGAATGTFTTLADSDADGLPDNWENQYFSNLNQTASGNPDGDALTNMDEYLRGTNPTVFDELPSDLVLHLLMDDDPADGVQDSSEYGQTGTVTSGLSPVLGSGQVNLGYSFDGLDDYVRFSNASLQGEFPGASGNPASSMTLAAWIKLSSLNDRHPILVKQTQPQRSFVFLKETDNTLALELSSDGVGSQTFHSNATLNVNTWYHVAVTYSPLSNGSVTLYINGIADGHFENVGGAPFGNAQDLNIGRYYWSDAYSRYFHGAIDEVRIYNRALSDAEIQSLASISGNSPPQFDSPGTQSVDVNTPLSFTINATDADGDTLSYNATNLPSGATFDSSTRQFLWTPGDADAGTHTASFSVTDGKGGTDVLGVTIQVTQPAGSITSGGSWQGVSIVPQSDLFTLEFDATPLAASIDGVTGLSNGVAGAYTDLAVVLRFFTNGFIDARNGSVYAAENSVAYQANTTYHFRLEVDLPNHRYNAYVKPEGGSEVLLGNQFAFRSEQQTATTLTALSVAPGGPHRVSNVQIATYTPNQSPVLNPIGNRTVRENSQLFFSISATDPDGDALIYFAENLPFGAAFTGNIFYWTPSLNDAGVYDITFVVNDTRNGSDSETIQITVEDFNQNPLLDAIGNQFVQENEPLSFTVSGSDPDGNFLTYTATNLPVGATFADQTFSWTPTFDQAGSYEVTFNVTDGELEDSEVVAIDVNNVNRPPVLDPIDDVNVNENNPILFSVSASDPDGDAVSYSILNLPAGADFTNQTFAWTPGTNDAGSYQVTIIADDGQLQDSQIVNVTVGDVNLPPVLDPIGPQTVSENQLLNFSISASDPEGDNLTYTATNLPTGADLTGQQFQWTPTLDQAGTYTITVTVSDGQLQDSETVTVTVLNTNQPPTLDPVGPQTVNENQLLSFSINASDPDGDNLTYSATNLPTGADLTGQQLQWTPTLDQAGTYTITVTVSDGQLQDSDTVTVTVLNANQPPTLDPISPQTVNEGQLLNFSISASDPDGDVLIYSAADLPAGAGLTGQSFQWTPTLAQAGTYTITVTASDGQSQDSEAVTLTVLNTNQPPVLDPPGSKTVSENQLLSFSVSASDPDGDSLTYSAVNLPTGASLTGQLFQWTPTLDQAGTYTITVAASDGQLQDSKTVTLTVLNTNQPPALDPIGSQTVNETQLLSFPVSGADPDDDSLIFTAIGLPSGASLSNQTFSWTPTKDQDGIYNLTFIVSDGQLQDSEAITITVLNGNRPPALEPIDPQSVEENKQLSFTVNATDPDNDTLQYSISPLPSGADFSNQTFSWKPGFTDSGSYTLTIAASDGELQDSESVSITVFNTNRGPNFDSPGNSRKIKESTSLSFQVSASDPDGDAVSYSTETMPTGASLEADTFTWTPTYDDAGLYDVTFIASDGELQSTQTVSIEVENVNRAPVLADVSAISVAEDEPVQFVVTATDPDQDAVTYSATNLPTGADFTDQAFNWTPGFDDAGVYDVSVTASDGELEDYLTVTIVVGSTNRPPVFDPVTDPGINENESLDLAISASDPDGDELTLQALNLPEGAQFQGSALQWTPSFEQAGHYVITFEANDGTVTVRKDVSVTVNNVNRVPVIEPIADLLVNENESVQTTLAATDPDGDPVTLEAMQLPVGATFESDVLHWTPGYDDAGVYTIRVKASDGLGEDNRDLIITVNNVNRPPVLQALNEQIVMADVSTNLALTATDPDGDPVIITAGNLPEGATFDGASLQWTPTLEQEGSYNVIVTASDGDLQDSMILALTVAIGNRPPVITAPPNFYTNINEVVQFTVQVSDPDGDLVTLNNSGLPGGAQFSNQSFSWTPASDQSGITIVTFTADDGQLQSSATVLIYVLPGTVDSVPPAVTRVSPRSNAIQVERNTLVVAELADADSGIDPDTVSIEANGEIIYQGNVNQYESSLGTCRRSGTPTRYTYILQPLGYFDNDQTVSLRIQARDQAGNAMSVFQSQFTTEMYTFGVANRVNADAAVCDHPVTVRDTGGTIWIAWEQGNPGSRRIKVSRKAGGQSSIVTPAETTGDQTQAALAVGNGQVYLTWQEKINNRWQVFLSYSSDGTNWTAPVQISQTNGNQIHPTVAAQDQTVYVAWQDDRSGNQDIYAAHSDDGFATHTVQAVTQNTANQLDPVVTLANGSAYVVWTDLRNGTTDLYGAASHTGWANIAVVNHPANQSQPALASLPDASSLYLAWVDDRSGNDDIFYAVLPAGLGSTPTSGINLVDDTLGRNQTAPSVMVTQRDGITRGFVSWQDERYSSPNTDNDIFFAAMQSGQPTNVLVTAESSGANQTVPALGAGAQGQPYLVWIDRRSKGQDVYCTGATNISGEQVAVQSISTASGGVVGTPVAEIDSVEDVSAEVPVGAFPSDVMLTIFRVDNPVGGESVGEVLSAYDFGPSIDGEFAKPVTLTIPYEVDDPKVQTDIFWYNPQTGELTQAGLSQIETIEITPTLRAFRFRTSHFSQFVLGEVDAGKPRSSSGGGGGCTLAVTESHSVSLVEYLLPWFVLGGVVGWIRRKTAVTVKVH